MKFHIIDPEVIVGLGENTEMDSTVHPPIVSRLHIDLEDWLGDDLMEIFPCYVVTEALAKGLDSAGFSGYKIDVLTVSEAQYFRNNYALQKRLPPFFWLKITGKINTDDFFMNDQLKLSISSRVLYYLRSNFSIKYAEVDSPDRFNDLFAGL